MAGLLNSIRRTITNQVVIDTIVAVALTGVSVVTVFGVIPELDIPYRAVDVLGLILIGLQTLPLAVRQRSPTGVWTTTGLSLTAYSLLGYPPSAGGIGVLIALYTVAANTDRRTALIAGAVTTVGIGLSIAGSFLSTGLQAQDLVVTTIANYLIYATAWILGDNIRVRRAYTKALEARAALLERERGEHARLAVAEERSRIARELHDVVAHHVSVMVVQAGAARRILANQPDVATEALSDVERTGRQALTEMRRMLGVLRSDEPAEGLLPQPTLDHLDRLVSELRDAGLPTELRIEGTPRTLPAGVDVNAYRIVQEALTNVLKHGGAAAHASVRVRYDPRSLVLDISDDGQGAAAAVLSRGDGGQGLLGMRERVLLHGGELEAGPRTSGGFRVLARLPIEDAATVEESSPPAPGAGDPGTGPAPASVSSSAPASARALPPTPAADPPA